MVWGKCVVVAAARVVLRLSLTHRSDFDGLPSHLIMTMFGD